VTKHVLSVVFKADYVSGQLVIQPEEIAEAKFIALNESNIDQYITRPNQRSRTLAAMKAETFIPYETWEVSPAYQLMGRLIPGQE
jgi:8-oxo-dGTP diphosphatase